MYQNQGEVISTRETKPNEAEIGQQLPFLTQQNTWAKEEQPALPSPPGCPPRYKETDKQPHTCRSSNRTFIQMSLQSLKNKLFWGEIGY